MNKIVKINATENDLDAVRKYEKKSMLKTMQKHEGKRINSENKDIARRISTQ